MPGGCRSIDDAPESSYNVLKELCQKTKIESLEDTPKSPVVVEHEGYAHRKKRSVFAGYPCNPERERGAKYAKI